MQLRKLLLTVSCLLLFTLNATAEFSQRVSITGGTAQQLSAVLAANNYTGTRALDFLEICNLQSNTVTMYIGHKSTVNASTGTAYYAGECAMWPPGTKYADTTKIYIYFATTQTVEVKFRERG